ncbi:hypothetical protein MAR_010616 [Mya arenaria]|uniref:Uncharacterized protein n=1 Tax=Mya arenaria TaxID=6604 RepID=A0ABY7E5I6_MYAAR|nr:hypothetical protein MAR_010616 [Mya arenaria]
MVNICIEFSHQEFWRKFRFELLDIHMEVLYFKRVLERLASFCRAGNESVERSLEVETSTWDAGFRVAFFTVHPKARVPAPMVEG